MFFYRDDYNSTTEYLQNYELVAKIITENTAQSVSNLNVAIKKCPVIDKITSYQKHLR